MSRASDMDGMTEMLFGFVRWVCFTAFAVQYRANGSTVDVSPAVGRRFNMVWRAVVAVGRWYWCAVGVAFVGMLAWWVFVYAP